ncbi:nucleotidyltransferase domain-containing protein [Geoglobus acetivorans]|uniref:Polymerase nucleotidyl transferase domain-containing protein n=1 Tax=Geoglobus acetivorans TaxID=565033 RepID=A0A0A7GGN6_GEOAI|nr:hypothetical protein GACE_1973 [Geoglobus acetivorans]
MNYLMDFKTLVDEVVTVAKPKLVAIFGSQARGDAGRFSDIDVLVVTDSDVVAEKLNTMRKGNVEFHALSMKRALELVHRSDPFFKKILSEAIPLYGHFYLSFLREVAENVGKGKNMA